MKDDYISRQAAIKLAIDLDYESSGILKESRCRDIEIRYNMIPSAQPENKELSAWKEDFRDYIRMLNLPRDDYNGIMGYINEVSSAQPEIIRCNSCKYWAQTTGKMKGYGLGRCDFHDAQLVTCDGFCYWAEREKDER